MLLCSFAQHTILGLAASHFVSLDQYIYLRLAGNATGELTSSSTYFGGSAWKRVFDELGARVGGENKAMTELKKSFHGKSLAVRLFILQLPSY